MNKNSTKLGLLMSVTALVSFVLYIICFTCILMVNQPFTWTNINDLAAYEINNQSVFKYIGMICMIVFSCTFVVMVLCIGEKAGEEKKVIANTASLFALAFCVSISINYFVQITATRMQMQNGFTEGLTQFTQSNNISALNAINMLGWTVFYAISSLVLGYLFDDSRLGKAAKWFCTANSIIMITGFIGYMLNHFMILMLTMNMGLGAASIGIIVCIMLYLKKSLTD